MILRTSLLAALSLGMSTTALAWEHLEHAWLPDDMPLRIYVAEPDCEETVPQDVILDSTGESGTYCRQATEQAWSIWTSTPCIDLTWEYAGDCENIGYATNYKLYNTFNDPDDDLEPGVIAAALTPTYGSTAFILDGTKYRHAKDSDIVYNDDVNFATHEDVLAGNCESSHDMLGIAVHEIGHTIGLGHSCEENEVCSDPKLKDATMYWQGPSCATELASPNEDDLESITALYGPYATFECSHEQTSDLAVGIVPFDLKCVIKADNINEVVGAQWYFGDGGSSDDIHVTHEYTEPGNYTIQVTVNGERDECGDNGWAYNYRKVGYVRACGIPEVSFEVEKIEGYSFQMYNDTDISVYGCVSDVLWEVYSGSGVSGDPIASYKAWEPIVTVPDDGTYTIVAHVGGIGGTGAAEYVLDTTSVGGGCSSLGVLGGGSFALMLASLGLVRRRQS
jgi:hypothetical protein